jgi:hypothetical protein
VSGRTCGQIPRICNAGEFTKMSTAETQNPGAKTYTRVVSILMVVLIAYGVLALLGVIK